MTRAPNVPMPVGKPRCPVTGEPAARLVQWVSPKLLSELWRIAFRVDVRPSFKNTPRFGLWRSPTGLYFFDPPVVGDDAFYETFYDHPAVRAFVSHGEKAEFRLAGSYVGAGDKVLDVGCGWGGFRPSVSHADYVGLDPHPVFRPAPDWLKAETLSEHAASNPGGYDAVCALQVIEHVADPVSMAVDMARATRPGGRVIIGVPHAPSANTRLPNNLINAPPHHVTWWTKTALERLADRVGLRVEAIDSAPWTGGDGLIYWAARCSPAHTGPRFFRHSWKWHASVLAGLAAGFVMSRLRGAPRVRVEDEAASLLLVARKPG